MDYDQDPSYRNEDRGPKKLFNLKNEIKYVLILGAIVYLLSLIHN